MHADVWSGEAISGSAHKHGPGARHNTRDACFPLVNPAANVIDLVQTAWSIRLAPSASTGLGNNVGQSAQGTEAGKRRPPFLPGVGFTYTSSSSGQTLPEQRCTAQRPCTRTAFLLLKPDSTDMASTRAKRAAEAASGRDKAAKAEQAQATTAEQQNGEVQKRRRSPSPARRDDKRRRTASPQVGRATWATNWCRNIQAQSRRIGRLLGVFVHVRHSIAILQLWHGLSRIRQAPSGCCQAVQRRWMRQASVARNLQVVACCDL